MNNENYGDHQMRLLILGLLGTALLGGSMTASASLLGQEITAGYYFPNAATPYVNSSFTPATFSVAAGQETVGQLEGVTTLLVDFDANSLSVILNTVLSAPAWFSSDFNGLIFRATLPHGISGATVDASTTMGGFDISRVSFDANRILLNWNGLSYVDGTLVKVNFAFSPVPEPGTLALLGVGVALLGLSRRSKV